MHTKIYQNMIAWTACFCLIALPAGMSQAQEMTDLEISDQIDDELLFDQGVNSLNVDVSTTNGIVTLEGTVDNILAKERSVRLAETVRGVRSVVNQIEVEPATLRTDSEIQNDVEDALLEDPATESFEVDVSVANGAVTLDGEVESWQEKNLVATVSKGVRGVTAVENDLAVDYETQRPDIEIAEEVRQALEWNVYIDNADLINVEVDDGVVTLSGEVGSAAEKRKAETAAWTAGVTDVKSKKLTVNSLLDEAAERDTALPDVPEAEVRDAVTDALLYDPRVNSFEVNVDVTGGLVTLRGTVSNLRAKRAAEQDARNSLGVYSVVNRIKVRSDETTFSDETIDTYVESALDRNPYLEDYEVTAVVDNGVVDLYGTVDSWFEKTEAEEAAATVAGVISVDNNLVVETGYDTYTYDPYVDDYDLYEYDWYDYTPGVTVDSDAEIAEEIRNELWWSPFVDSDEITVSVADGRATLTGTVDSWSDRSVAAENAIEGGATSVTNNLIVE